MKLTVDWDHGLTAAFANRAQLVRRAGYERRPRYRCAVSSRAEGLRNLANDKTAFAIRDQLLLIAEQYDRLAAMLEDIDATNVTMERSAALVLPITKQAPGFRLRPFRSRGTRSKIARLD
jgi:hypothetical protein